MAYLVGAGLGAPDYRPHVCVIDLAPASALELFVDGTVDLLLGNQGIPNEWRRKLRSSGASLSADGTCNLTLAECDDPDVSIVIPMHGRLDLTRRCLRSLAIYQSAMRVEVIVVDDGSPDESASPLSAQRGVRLVRLAENAGFGHACNRGAEAARGRFLVFLNNDTEVTADWLDELHRTFVDVPDAGLVGAKLVYPNGRLQEAGGVIFRDGSAMNFGRDGDPGHPAYNMMREVDYCSAACIMVPTDVFRRLDGFDPLYAPAYYEDSDFAFRVRQLGRRVLYQPLSCVIHYEGATSGTDLRRGPKRFQVLNQQKFRDRWASVLSRYPEPPHQSDAEGAMPSGEEGPGHRPDDTAARARCRIGANGSAAALLQRAGLQVTLVTQDLSGAGSDAANLRRRGIEVLCAPWVTSVRQHLEQDGQRYDIVVLSAPRSSRNAPADRSGTGSAGGRSVRHCRPPLRPRDAGGAIARRCRGFDAGLGATAG